MSNIIREIEQIMLSYLLQTIAIDEKISLLKQDEDIEKQRNYYIDLRSRILVIKKNFYKT